MAWDGCLSSVKAPGLTRLCSLLSHIRAVGWTIYTGDAGARATWEENIAGTQKPPG